MQSERNAMPLSVISIPVKGCMIDWLALNVRPTGLLSMPGLSCSRLMPKSCLRNVMPRSIRALSRRPCSCGSSVSVVSA